MEKRAYAFMANGMEEVECLAVVDMLVRGGIRVTKVSVEEEKTVTGAHGITVVADALFSEIDPAQADVLFLPGGMPGTLHLKAHEGLAAALLAAEGRGQRIAAICAAPIVLGGLGLMKGRRGTCYPGEDLECQMTGYTRVPEGVVTDGYITTGRGVGFAIDLGLELVALLRGRDLSEQIRESIQYNWPVR